MALQNKNGTCTESETGKFAKSAGTPKETVCNSSQPLGNKSLTNSQEVKEPTEENHKKNTWTFDDWSSTYCSLCRIYFTGAVAAVQHYASQKHMDKMEQEQLPSSVKSPPPQNPVTAQMIQEMKSSPVVADVKVKTEQIEVRLEDNKEHCSVCNIYFTGPQAATQHYTGRKHAQRVEKEHISQVGQQAPLQENPSVIEVGKDKKSNLSYCGACNVYFTGPQAALQHYAGKKHAQKASLNKKDQKDPLHSEICSVCHTLLLGIEQAGMHYMGKKHQKKVEQMKLVSECHEVDDINKSEYLIELLNSLLAPPLCFDPASTTAISLEKLVNDKLVNSLKCIVCSKVFNGLKPMNDHLFSKKHYQKVELFQSELALEFKIKPSEFGSILPRILNIVSTHASQTNKNDEQKLFSESTEEFSKEDEIILDNILNEFNIPEISVEELIDDMVKKIVDTNAVCDNDGTIKESFSRSDDANDNTEESTADGKNDSTEPTASTSVCDESMISENTTSPEDEKTPSSASIISSVKSRRGRRKKLAIGTSDTPVAAKRRKN